MSAHWIYTENIVILVRLLLSFHLWRSVQIFRFNYLLQISPSLFKFLITLVTLHLSHQISSSFFPVCIENTLTITTSKRIVNFSARPMTLTTAPQHKICLVTLFLVLLTEQAAPSDKQLLKTITGDFIKRWKFRCKWQIFTLLITEIPHFLATKTQIFTLEKFLNQGLSYICWWIWIAVQSG